MKVSELKKGQVVTYNAQIYQIREMERSAPQGRGGNVRYRCVMYSIPAQQKLDVSFDAEDQLTETPLERRPASFSFKEGEAYVFMDDATFAQYVLDPDIVGTSAHFITEGLEGAFVQVLDEMPIGLQLPQTVVLTVVDTPPELKGGSATKRHKPAIVNTGLEVMVPEYIANGERIFVNTTTATFSGRCG